MLQIRMNCLTKNRCIISVAKSNICCESVAIKIEYPLNDVLIKEDIQLNTVF